MSSNFFSICNNSSLEQKQTNPEPLKFKFLKAINLFNPLLRSFLFPNKQQKYTFSHDYLYFVKHGDRDQIPVVYLPARVPEQSLIMIYSHGSGSTLNNVFNFGVNMMIKYEIAVVMYDYNGEGEGRGEFVSYQNDMKSILAWVLQRGYSPSKTILCGFSIGSYPTLHVPGPMARLLLSPICGLIPLIEGTAQKYEGEPFDNITNAKKIQARVLIVHCKDEFIPISHSHAIVRALQNLNEETAINFYEIEGYNHQNVPSFLLGNDAGVLVKRFLKRVLIESKEVEKGQRFDKNWNLYKTELKVWAKFQSTTKASSI